MKSSSVRVLMLVENGPFPFDRRMRHLAEALQGSGYQVTVICPQGEEHDRHRVDEHCGVKVYRYPVWFQASSKLGYLLEYGWALICLSLFTFYVWLKDGIDIIHSANPPDLMFLVALPYKLLGKKFVYDQHDLCPELYLSKFDRQGLAYRILLILERASYKTANLVISTNQSYRDIARERGDVDDQRSAIVRNGVNLNKFHCRDGRPELKSGFRYMTVYLGVMGKQDGVDRVMQAAYHVVHTFHRTDVKFALIGKGECWLALQKLAAELNISEYVQFLGYVSDSVLLDYLSTADVGLAPDPPDRMNQLSTMTKIMEYMACQRPIVSFDLLETRRSAGDAACYVPTDDSKLFAKNLIELLDDETRRTRMGKVGLERSRELVGLDRSRKALLEGYSRMLGGAPHATDLIATEEQSENVQSATFR